jgi:purine-cytosine permease-like protein
MDVLILLCVVLVTGFGRALQTKFSKYGWFLMPLGVVYWTILASAHVSKGVEVISKVVDPH